MEPFLGEIRLFAGNYAPSGWAICDGRSLPIANNNALYSLLSTIYGGDGVNTFNLPDLRGRLPVHQGTGPGLSPNSLGAKAGTETVALTPSQLPSHNHAMLASLDGAQTANPQNNVLAASTVSFYSAADASTLVGMASTMVASTGGSQPHNNLMPYLCVNYIIALQGIYPTQN